MFPVPALGMYVDRFAVLLAEQIALGQRRSNVRALPLVSDDEERPVVAVLAQFFRGLAGGQAAPDDHERIRRRHDDSRPRL